jgi:hypothetical protein
MIEYISKFQSILSSAWIKDNNLVQQSFCVYGSMHTIILIIELNIEALGGENQEHVLVDD